MDLAGRFKALRKAKDVSIYCLSNKSDVSENYIHKIENGENQPSIYILEKLLSCFGVKLSEFLNEDTDVLYPSEFEKELIENIRLLNDEKASAILQLVKLMVK